MSHKAINRADLQSEQQRSSCPNKRALEFAYHANPQNKPYVSFAKLLIYNWHPCNKELGSLTM